MDVGNSSSPFVVFIADGATVKGPSGTRTNGSLRVAEVAMSKAHVLTRNPALDAHEAGRTALGLAILLALLAVAALSFADHLGQQATPDEIVQFGD